MRSSPWNLRYVLVAGVLSGFVPRASEARVVQFVVEHREPFAGGVDWGNAGPYERLFGTAFMEVDPRDPLNAGIVDLDKAPRNARGMVEFSTPFYMVKPVDMVRGNRKIFYTINNRGNALAVDFAHPLISARTAADVGDNDILLRMGFTVVDAGWEGDVVPLFTSAGTPANLPANVPVAAQPDGSPILGLMRVEYSDRNLPLAGTFTLNLEGNPAFRSYETADANTAHATFTVRNDVNSAKTPIGSDRWAFARCPTGPASLAPSTTDICYFDGFQNDKIYELIYVAKNPLVMGLGFATTRDVASFLRYQASDDAGNPNPLGTGIRRAYATGASQTGGYLRDYMYLGFNEDESHRKVFDAIIPTIAGTDRVFINVRFADPNVWSDQDDRHDLLQNSYGVFTYAVHTDPVSGIRDGVMKRPATDPLVFQIDSESEFWQLRGGLNVADGAGVPVDLPENVRLYFVSSTAHAFVAGGLGRTTGANPLCVNPTGSLTTETTRAAVVAMDLWADGNVAPPRSNYPRLEDRTLIPLEEAAERFPAIPGVAFPSVMNELPLWNFGPLFSVVGGVLTLQPPLTSLHYREFVPASDRDGLNIAGVRPMEVRAPLGTSAGWNNRRPAHRPGNLCDLTGSYLAFAQTRSDRLAAGDPRLSLEERYHTHEGFVDAVRRAARQLVRDRFLLPEDAARFEAQAESSDVLR
jgi:Alpha/beta hydrolase domain